MCALSLSVKEEVHKTDESLNEELEIESDNEAIANVLVLFLCYFTFSTILIKLFGSPFAISAIGIIAFWMENTDKQNKNGPNMHITSSAMAELKPEKYVNTYTHTNSEKSDIE